LILPTIRSRCQTLTFSQVFKEDIERILLEKGYEAEKARTISLLVRGNLKLALDLDWEDVQEKRQKAWQFFVSLIKGEKTSQHLSELSARQLEKSEREQVFEILASFCRDVILKKEGGESKNMMNPDLELEIQDVARLISREQSLDFLRKIDYSLYALQKNLNVNLLVSSFFSHFMEERHD
jgi:DNA polymerase III gamma/tau subunit